MTPNDSIVLQRTELAGSQYCYSRFVLFSVESVACVSTLESVRGNGSLSTELADVQPAAKLRNDVQPKA